MLLKLEKDVQLVAVIILILFVSGCESIPIDNFCLWANPIIVTKEENSNLLSESTLRQIDDYNQEWEVKCGE